MLQELKSQLKISNNAQDDNLQSFIEEGKYSLNELYGSEIDYSKDLSSKSLLFSYCRYRYNNAEELFYINFQSQLRKVALKGGVADVKKRKTSTE